MRDAKLRAVLLGLALFVWWARYFPPGVDGLVFDDDARQHVYWTAIFEDPGLFPGDIMTRFIASNLFDPLGYQALYRVGVKFMEPLAFSRLLTIVLLAASLLLLDALLKRIRAGWRGRLLGGVLFLFFSIYSASGGLPRSFAFPLLLGFLLLLESGAFRWAMAEALLIPFFYPPLILNVLALGGWSLLRRWPVWPVRSERSGLLLLRGSFLEKFFAPGGETRANRVRDWVLDGAVIAVAAIVSGAVLVSVYGGKPDAYLGPKVTFEETKTMPEFHPGGRTVFFRDGALAYYLQAPSGIGWEYLAGFGCILAVMAGARALAKGRGRRAGEAGMSMPPVVGGLVATSLALFVLAHVMLFKLHHPSRYTLYTLPVALMIWIGTGAESVCMALRRDDSEAEDAAPSFPVGRWLGIGFGLLLAAVYAYAQGHYISRVDPLEVHLDRADLDMLARLEQLPKDALIAGHPMDMNNVPLVARRKVLANQELSLPYYRNYYGELRTRIFDFFDAYYSHDWDSVEDFVKRWKVDALVVNKTQLTKAFLDGPIYYEPFRSAVKARLHTEGEGGFALENPPENLRCFENERYVSLCFPREQE
ncbi:MAG: hypothetical protein AB7W37_02820 [Syntrophobacteraceae bacterium]